jgi:hypothetical protein
MPTDTVQADKYVKNARFLRWIDAPAKSRPGPKPAYRTALDQMARCVAILVHASVAHVNLAEMPAGKIAFVESAP